jgi:hypothetical protein
MTFDARISFERADALYQNVKLAPLTKVPVKLDFALTHLSPDDLATTSIMLNMNGERVSQIICKETGSVKPKEIRIYEVYSEGPRSSEPSIVSLQNELNVGELEQGYPLIVGAGKDETAFPPAAFALTHQGGHMVRVDCFHPGGIFIGLDIVKKPKIGTELGHISIKNNIKWLNNFMPSRANIIANALRTKELRDNNEWCKEASIIDQGVIFPVRISLEGEFLGGGREDGKEYFIAYFGYKARGEGLTQAAKFSGTEEIGFGIELSRFPLDVLVGQEILGTHIIGNAAIPKVICAVADASIEYYNRPMRGNIV